MNAARRVFLLLILPLFLLKPYLPMASAEETGNPFGIELTEVEKEFIKEHPVITLGVDPTFIPYEFFDTDGIYKGIAADYIDLICKRTGIQMVVVKDLTWSEAYEKAAAREIDVLPCVGETAERGKHFLFSNTYYTFKRAVFINQNNNAVKSFTDLHGKTVAVQENSSHHTYLLTYGDINLSLYKTVVEALQAVSNGNEAVYVGNLATSTYLMKSYGITNLKYFILGSGSADESQSLHFAVRNDWPELVSIINKALAGVTEEEKIEINNKWIGAEKTVDYTRIIRLVGIIASPIILILAVSFFWIVRLRKEIAGRRAAEEELRTAKDEAEKANQIKSMFLARMSHEIRTPLNAIMGMAYLIKKTDVTATQMSYLEKLTHAARNMLDIINDILDFSKIESGKVELERVSFNLDEVLKRVIHIISVRVEEQGIEFTMYRAPDMPSFFWGDPMRLEQILLNVVNNAVKFTKEGSVSLTVRSVSSDNNIYTAEFCVKDTGVGISKEQLDRLFIPFDQGDSSINRRFGGTGLGLSIVKNLTDLMGGSVEVSSAPGAGSTFLIVLPLEADTGRVQSETNTMGAECFRHIRALIIDKSEPTRNKLMQYCRSFGIDSESAESEDDAIQRIYQAAVGDKRPFNLIITDYSTPKNGGIEFFCGLKKINSAAWKFILLIPMSKESIYDEAQAAGIDFWITKPVLPSVLYNGIVEIFGIKPPEKREPPESADIPLAAYPYHILLVEDNKTNQLIAQRIMELAGFRVSTADNGEEGYMFFTEYRNNLDLILMDIHMPVMNGYEAADLIRKIDSAIPIVAMTADAVMGVAEECRNHGMVHYVSKPFEPDRFIQTISDVLEANRRMTPENGNSGCEPILSTGEGIKRIGGDLALYRMVLQTFHEENTQVEALLKENIGGRDYAGAVQIVHKIKSSAGNIGAKRLFEASSELQKALNAGDEIGIAQWHELFQSLLRKLLEEITEYLTIPQE